MFNPVEALRDNPALFACYILFVYFRGKNAVRIEREMRALGHTTFHRRNLYPRGKQPGWIAKFDWRTQAEPPASAGGEASAYRSFEQDRQDKQDGRTPKRDADHPVHPVHPVPIPAEPEQPDFHSWLKRVSPNMTWDWKHQQVIINQLEKVSTGECKRLMIFLPPRHGKSELVSVRYTAWRMQKDPSMNVILGSYNQRLADRMSRKIRTVICDAETQAVPPASAGGETSAHRSFKQDRQDKQDGKSPKPNADHPVHLVHPVPNPSEHGSPFPFSRPRPKNAVSEWETSMGGSFRAVGSGSGVTGFGANLIVIDDPVKNRAQAESETFRNRVWDWYKDDLYTRLEPDGSIVLIQTRWHEDDLAGRLLRDNLDDWTVINLPALSEPGAIATGLPSEPPASAGGQLVGAKEPPMDADQREYMSVPPAVAGGDVPAQSLFRQDEQDKQDAEPLDDRKEHPLNPVHPVNTSSFEWRKAPNIALCPERFDIDALDRLKTQLGTYAFSALFQQRPTPAGGQIFKREWFKQIIDFAPPGLRWTRGYDLAVSTSTESDYTASFRVAFDDKTGTMYISGGFRRRIEFPDQRRYIIDRMLNERDTQHGVELALHGQALLQDLRRDPALRGKPLRGVKVSTDKLTRALTWSPTAEEGKVILVRQSVFTGETQSRRDILKQDEQDRQDGLGDTEISPPIKKHPLHPAHPVENYPQPTRADWISDLLDELAAFPNGTHDDQIDAISIAVQLHAHKPRTGTGMLIT